MRLKAVISTAVLAAAATAAWAHPGHGAEGEAHHFVDLLALGGIAAVFALVLAGREKGGKDHD
jgi:hypothetical protein